MTFTPTKPRSAAVSEQQLRMAIDATKLTIWDFHFATDVVTCSENARELWGFEHGTSEAFYDRVHPDDRAPLAAETDAAITGVRPFQLEYRVIGADGVYHWVRSRAQVMFDRDGKPERMIGVSGIIDDQKLAERRMLEHEERMKLALRAAGAGTWDLNVPSGQVLWSEEAHQLHGSAGADTLTYDSWLGLVHPEDRGRTETLVQHAVQHGGDVTLEYRVALSARGKRWLVSIGQAIPDERGKVTRLSGIVLDITERRQVEERLRQSAKMEAIGQLAGGLAHDFNNQLHALSGLLDFVARDPGLSETSQSDLTEIRTTADRMASLTRQLLAFSRQQVLLPETIELNRAVMETKPMLQRLIGSNLEMNLELSPELNWVRMDRTQLLQVLMNLVINARDAMPEGGRLTIRVDTRVIRSRELDAIARGPVLPGTYAQMVVSDSGSGIEPEDLTRIFDPFFTTKPVGEGTGLGLATVDGILNQNKGHIWAESRTGEGATFYVLLPITTPPQEPPLPATTPPVTGRRARLLVVDDEEMVREVIVRTLQNQGYDVLQAGHGEEAIEQLARVEGNVDLVISDVVMPVMGGAELAVRMSQQFPLVPIVWMSGYPRETIIGNGRLGEDQPFLQKPVPPAILLSTVAREVSAR